MIQIVFFPFYEKCISATINVISDCFHIFGKVIIDFNNQIVLSLSPIAHIICHTIHLLFITSKYTEISCLPLSAWLQL